MLLITYQNPIILKQLNHDKIIKFNLNFINKNDQRYTPYDWVRCKMQIENFPIWCWNYKDIKALNKIIKTDNEINLKNVQIIFEPPTSSKIFSTNYHVWDQGHYNAFPEAPDYWYQKFLIPNLNNLYNKCNKKCIKCTKNIPQFQYCVDIIDLKDICFIKNI